MVLNDFKSIAGDRALGIRTLPVQLGVRRAALFACVAMLLPQLGVIALLAWSSRTVEPIAVSVLVLLQLSFMPQLVRAPCERAPRYNMTGVSCFVFGMMISAFAIRALH